MDSLKKTLRKLGFWMLSVTAAAVVLIFGGVSEAKELSSRLGVGFSNEYSINLPSIAAVYYPSSSWGVTGALGIDTANQNSNFGVQGGVRKILFKEENMNFFMGGLLSLLSQSVGGNNNSGFELSAVVGGEFFLPGLENLGFTFDTGIGISDVGTTRFRTLGNSFLTGGIIFYF
jgi:hypothetical protein